MEKNDCVDREIQSAASKVVESVAAKWTNEKHESYLNSIEASFVKQLHNNKLFDWSWRTPEHTASLGLVPKRQSSSQFKVQHRGCWENSEFEKDDKAMPFCFRKLHKVSIGSVTEVSDQNFMDINVADEGLSKRRGKKRARSTVCSVTDQVVPFMTPMPKEESEELRKNKLQKMGSSLHMKS